MKNEYLKMKIIVVFGMILVFAITCVAGFFAGVEYTRNKAKVISIGDSEAIISVGYDKYIVDLVRY